MARTREIANYKTTFMDGHLRRLYVLVGYRNDKDDEPIYELRKTWWANKAGE